MKAKSIIKFAAVCIVIAIIAYVAAFGVSFMGKTISPSFDEDFGIEKGFDLAGGSVIVFEPKDVDLKKVTDSQLDAASAALRLRLDSNGLNDATVSVQSNDDVKRLRVEIPALTDPNEAISYLGAMASLVFKDSNGTEIISGKHVKDASGMINQESGKPVVQLTLTGEGRELFAEATTRIKDLADGNNYIAIYVDETEISRPSVSVGINSETCIIEGEFTADAANQLANQIKSGTLPFALEPISQNSVGAQLGDDALAKSLMAGGIGLALVILFMIIFYRLCGLVASISLVGYLSIVLLILNGMDIQLTLPGIAGIILTIGTAVDANVIIFERVKEELRKGNMIRTAVDSGFKRAFSSIIDSNITTLIAAVVLWWLGSGTIVGFAKTLFIGTLVSMFTAVFVTRFLLRQVCIFGGKNPKLYSA
ncbi:MAG: protein translocase subunit SecD [Clostridia bacterium]|nr:protein translocase subunit SecD [Clostridia bacterium]